MIFQIGYFPSLLPIPSPGLTFVVLFQSEKYDIVLQVFVCTVRRLSFELKAYLRYKLGRGRDVRRAAILLLRFIEHKLCIQEFNIFKGFIMVVCCCPFRTMLMNIGREILFLNFFSELCLFCCLNLFIRSQPYVGKRLRLFLPDRTKISR